MGTSGNRVGLPSLLREVLEVHKQRFNNLVTLLQSHIDLEVSKVLLANEEIRVAEEDGQVDLELVRSMKIRKNVAENELRKFECLSQHLFDNPGSSAVVDFVGVNLRYCPWTRTTIE